MSAASLPDILRAFEASPVFATRAMRDLVETDAPAFLAAALRELREPHDARVKRSLLVLLDARGLLFPVLGDPALGAEEVEGLARMIYSIDGQFHLRMARWVAQAGLDDAAVTRLLPVLGKLGESPGLAPALAPLLRHSNPHIRSKAALLIGRGCRSSRWAEQQMATADARVRANAIEALWHGEAAQCCPAFRSAARDPSCRVAGNAALGLYFAGEPESVPLLEGMASQASPDFRAAAAWCMGETEDPRFLPLLRDMLEGSEGRVRQKALRAIARIRSHLARGAEGSRLGVHVFDPVQVDAETRQAKVALTGLEEAEINGLTAVSFIPRENGRPIAGYRVSRVPVPAALAIGFVLPRRSEPDDALHQALSAALLECLRYRRPGDSWAVARYSAQDGSAGTGEQEMPCFSSDPETLAAAVSSVGRRQGNWTEAVRGMMRATLATRGSRHLVLVGDPDSATGSAAGIQKLDKTVSSQHLTVHGIPVGGCGYETIAQLVSTPGGCLLPIAGAGELAGALERVCQAVWHQFEITYRSGGAQLRLQVHCARGMAEGVCQTGGG